MAKKHSLEDQLKRANRQILELKDAFYPMRQYNG